MKTMAERIEWAMRQRGLNKNQLEVAAKMSAGYLSTAFKRKADDLKRETLGKLSLSLGVDLDWLADGGPSPNLRTFTPEEIQAIRQGAPAPDSTPANSGSRTIERDPPSAEQAKKFGDLPGWPEAEAEAREQFPDVPDFAFARARATSGAVLPEVVTPTLVAKWALAWFEQASADERHRAEKAEVQAALARFREQQKRGALVFRRASFSSTGGGGGPPAKRPPFQQRIKLILEGKYQEAGEPWPRFGREDHLAFVQSLRRKHVLPVGCDPRWWLEELGCDYGAVPDLGEVDGEAYDGHGKAVYSPVGGPRRWGLLLHHAAIHHANETLFAGEMHHTDVWFCTFELASPAVWLKERTPTEAFEQHPYLPLWWLEEYQRANSRWYLPNFWAGSY